MRARSCVIEKPCLIGIICRFEIEEVVKGRERSREVASSFLRAGEDETKVSPEPSKLHFVVMVCFNCFKRLRYAPQFGLCR